jgi:hypothetical protein
VSRLRRAVIAGLVALALPAAPAGAHSGGRAQLYVDSVHLEPQAGGWRADLVVRDGDSGKPEPGVGVQLAVEGGEAVTLTDAGGDGRYSALLPLTAGSWSVTVNADEIPGGPRALPFSRTWPATLVAGQPLDLGASGSLSAGAGGGGHLSAVLFGVGLGLLAVVALLDWRRRRRIWTGETALG